MKWVALGGPALLGDVPQGGLVDRLHIGGTPTSVRLFAEEVSCLQRSPPLRHSCNWVQLVRP